MSITIDFVADRIETEAMAKACDDGELRIHAIVTVDDPREILDAIDRETGGNGYIWDWLREHEEIYG
jgi:hypothetical protein